MTEKQFFFELKESLEITQKKLKAEIAKLKRTVETLEARNSKNEKKI